ncbi:cysteine desulfurase [Dyella caseinilytica]|uniref:Cysteine desulfurase n=1 Tax=Dyella caseinilytica TaxID=1849581 RepID=A0ABX7GVT5_9GAMM|nr:cysteine desulfurase [Dyella caseinilytica]QRN54577.1 cysteine desulfurase [Dyella caseinilytica]GFZ95362.1 cysteine desulfurase [Dyella caseinilytica]
MNAKPSHPSVDFDVQRVRLDFPLLSRTVHGKPLVYFDNANTSQKPLSVIEAVDRHYREHNANVARAVHQLGEEATAAYESARDKLAAFINAGSRNDVVLTSGTTQSMNLVAYSYALPRLQPGDAIVTTVMEHHANIVPWQLVAARSGATVKAAPIDQRGELILEKFFELLTPEVKLACVTHVSNVLGTVNPVREIARECRRRGIPLLVDGSQAMPHRPVDVQALGCDFYAITGHKMLAPTGTGALWAKREHLQSMPPFFGGGEMIREVRFDGTTFADPPHKFEAGTPNIAGFAGVGAAIDYIQSLGFEATRAWEHELLTYATERLREIPGLRIFGEAADKEPVISFLIEGAQATDLATLLDLEGVAVRSGHHCAHPLMQFYGVPATLRASLAFYNTREEVDAFIAALLKVRKLLL